MSVGNTNFQNTYTTDGTAGPWAFNWVYTEEMQVQVYLDLVLQSPSTYTVTKDLVNPGGTISFNAGSIPVLGRALLLQRFANTLQTDTLGTNQELPPATLVRMADKLTIIAQQISAQLVRALALPLTTIGFTATLPTPIAGAISVVNAANNAMAWVAPVQAGLALIDNGPGLPPTYGPLMSASGGNVASSGTSVIDNLAAFNNLGASLVKDSGVSKAAVAAVIAAASGLTHHGGRLSLSSTLSNPIADQVNATTVYLLPHIHNKTYVYVGGSWVQRTIVGQSLPISLGVFRKFDIYEFDNAGVLTLDANPWDSAGQVQFTVTNATIANPCVLTTSVAHSIVVGDLIGVYAAAATGTAWSDADRGLHGRRCYVSAVTGTTITVEGMDTTGLAITNYVGVFIARIPTSPTVGTATQDGVLVKSGDASRRFLGTVESDGGGLLQDSTSQRLVSNWYNREAARLKSDHAITSFVSASSSAYIPRGASTKMGFTRCEMVSCYDQPVAISVSDSNAVAGSNWFPCVFVNRCATIVEFSWQVAYAVGPSNSSCITRTKALAKGSYFFQHGIYGNGQTGAGSLTNNAQVGFDFLIQR